MAITKGFNKRGRRFTFRGWLSSLVAVLTNPGYYGIQYQVAFGGE